MVVDFPLGPMTYLALGSLRQGLSLKLQLANLAQPAGQQATQILLSLRILELGLQTCALVPSFDVALEMKLCFPCWPLQPE